MKRYDPTYLKEKYLSSMAETFCGAFSDSEYTFLPGFCDVHVHLREPGFSYKETIAMGSRAAAHGGFSDVCAMPNLNPVPDCPENLKFETDIISRDAVIGVHPYGAITLGEKGEELADLSGMAGHVVAFSDDGRGVQSGEMMAAAMEECARLGKIIAAHCEVNSLLHGGYIHDGRYAKEHSHTGICSESEWRQIERDIKLAKKTGCAYHVCHISTKESVSLIRQAKSDGVNISCETGPHYLIFDDSDLAEHGRFKMNPPLRDIKDREALIEGILDGTIDMIATDHAPHSEEEKSKGLLGSAFGIVGLETAFPAMYTHFVTTGIISLGRLIELMCINPRKRFKIPLKESYSVWKLGEKFTVDPISFLSKGRATPFEGMELLGVNYLSVYNGQIVYRKG